MEKKGFLNAPSITEFRRGMRMQHCERHDYYVVEWVSEDGWAWCRNDDGHGALVSYPFPSRFSLDLDSIWEGREYEHVRNTGDLATVLMTSPDYIAFYGNPKGRPRNDGWTDCYNRDSFLRNWAPVPLPGPVPEPTPEQPVKVGDVIKVENGYDWYIGQVSRTDAEWLSIGDSSKDELSCRLSWWLKHYPNLKITKFVPSP
jgi:hypothetical protein